MTTDVKKSGLKKPLIKWKRIFLIISVLIFAFVCAELLRSNNYIQTEYFAYKDKSIPKGFDGVKIVQISDYHNHGGAYDERLIKKVKEQKPDYIFITGDTADALRTDVDKANAFLAKVSKISDCYLVWGNHEYNIGDEKREKIARCCEENGITVLENEYAVLERGGDKILLVGTDDTVSQTYDELLETLPSDIDFTVWLHHYPEDFKYIADSSANAGVQADLLFAGHAHGGLVGLPFGSFGLYAPGQSFFPEYTSGEYEYGGTRMILSRGVGNSGYTKRFFNPYHLVVCTLERAG